MSLRKIRSLVEDEEYRLTSHAFEECRSRQISVQDIEDAIAIGQVIEKHIDDWGFDCYLIAGERFNGDVIHVACKIVDEYVQINTAYYPHAHLWLKDLIRRGRKKQRKRKR